MAYSEMLAHRIRKMLGQRNIVFEERKMMGGLTFMVDDKMCIGINYDSLMARINPDCYELALTKKGAREMDFTGQPMKGFLFISSEGVTMDSDLEYWIKECLNYNPKAHSSKKK